MDGGWRGLTTQWLSEVTGTGISFIYSASAASQSKCLQQTTPPRSVAMLLVVVPTMLLAYIAFLKLTSRGPTAGFERLRTKPPGAGKLGGAWTIFEPGTAGGGDGVSWLGENELKTLEAICDTLLPGFEIETRQAEDDTVDQVRGLVWYVTRTSVLSLRMSWSGFHY